MLLIINSGFSVPKLNVGYLFSLALTIALVGCAHTTPKNQYEQFTGIPERTEWKILSLKDFNTNNIRPFIDGSGRSRNLQDYSVTGVKNDAYQLFYLERIPSCEGGGGSISPAGKIEYIVLQGACTDLIWSDGKQIEVLSFKSLLEQNLISSLIVNGTVWHLDGEHLKLINANNVVLAEFLRLE